ncbi:MAG: helix-turn-helix domain-containing protein [Clostridiales bacterium]|nr:helix-turn-helix domain-containing protein [Clostridiales bacterium]
MTAAQLCPYIVRLLHAPVRVYNPEGTLTKLYVDNDEQEDVLERDAAFRKQLLEKGRENHPLLHLEANQVIYGIVQGVGETYLLGPCGLTDDTISAANLLKRLHGLSPDKPYRVSSAMIDDFYCVTMMLSEAVTGKSEDFNQMWLDSFCDTVMLEDESRQMNRVFYANQENRTLHNSYQQEMREQESIRTGNREALLESFGEASVGQIGRLASTKLRWAKNLAIVVITLASRSAIAGGVLPEIAFSMSDAFIQQVEQQQNEGDAITLARQAELEYCQAVHDMSAEAGRSTLVTDCRNLVLQQLHTRIEIQELARQLDVTPGYLSQTFLQEEGISLKDYITREKLRFAKQQLIYSNDSYETIAYTFAFSSQSHFGQVFKKWEGMTPGQYRKKYGHVK